MPLVLALARACHGDPVWRGRVVVLGLLLLLVVLALWGWANETFVGRVVGVIDGEALVVLHHGTPTIVRLRGIAAPTAQQPLHLASREHLRELAGLTLVTVAVRAHDLLGYPVADVFLVDGRSLSQEQVKSGMAWWRWPTEPHASDLARLEAEARSQHLGVWAQAKPVPPWEGPDGQYQPYHRLK